MRNNKFRHILIALTILATFGLAGCGGGAGEGEAELTTGGGGAPPSGGGSSGTDRTPPTVADVTPLQASTGVNVNASVSATFSEAITAASLTTTRFIVAPNGGGANVSGSVVVNGATGVFIPSVNLSPNTDYTAIILSGVTDRAGNALVSNYSWTFRTGAIPDTTPPTVNSISPANNATNVAVNASISATFSEPMANFTINTGSFVLERTSGAVPVAGTVNVTGNSATFTPSSPLAASTSYTATVRNTVTDAAGNALVLNRVWQFTTAAAPDTTRPTVSSTSPANNATNIALNASISATFSEAMRSDTITTTSFTVRPQVGTGPIAGSVTLSGNTATFRPTGFLAGSRIYIATITTVAKDAAGNSLAQDYVWTFTTTAAPDTTPPTVTGTFPISNATQVSITSSISATFSEPMTNSSLNTTSFTVRQGANAVTGTVSVSGNTATFNPTADLATSTVYTATISSNALTGARDSAGNVIVSDYVWSFTTSPPVDNTARLAWDAVGAATGYRVYYGTAPGTYFQPFAQGIVVGNVTTYTVTGLSLGTRYYFAVTAVDASNNESAFSNEVFKDIPLN